MKRKIATNEFEFRLKQNKQIENEKITLSKEMIKKRKRDADKANQKLTSYIQQHERREQNRTEQKKSEPNDRNGTFTEREKFCAIQVSLVASRVKAKESLFSRKNFNNSNSI